MADEQIKISIGAVENASIDRVFGNVRRKALKTAQDVTKAFQRGSAGWIQAHEKTKSAAAQAATAIAKSAKQAATAEERAAKGAAKEKERAERDWTKSFEAESRRRLRISEMELRRRTKAHRDAKRAELAEERRASREAARLQHRAGLDARRHAYRLSHRATRMFWPNAPMLSIGGRVAGDIARGIGVDTSATGAIQSARQAQSAATTLSSNAIVADDPRNADRVPASKLTSEARATGSKYGFTTAQGIAGLDAYSKRTGDLQTGRDLFEGVTRIAAATGSDLEELFGTAGELANQLTDVAPEEKSGAILELIKAFAGQSKLGAVELPDLAKYGARMFSTAGLYEGDRIENIKSLGALTQASRAFGGSDTAAMGATSTARLATTFKTTARAKEFERLTGKSVFGETGKVRDPIELIKEAVVATKGKPLDWNKIFMNVMAERAAGGFASKFRDAYDKTSGTDEQRTAAGTQAMDDFMEAMQKAALKEDQIAENIAERQKTVDALSIRINNSLEEVAEGFLVKFTPALEQATPALLELAKVLGTVATWVLENPKVAIASALGAAIARAGIETVLRAAIEKAVLSAGPSIGVGAGAGLKAALAGSASLIAPAVVAALIAWGAKEETDRRVKDLTNTVSEQDKVRSFAESALASGDRSKVATAYEKTHGALESVTAQADLRQSRRTQLMLGAPAAAGLTMPSMVAQETTELTVLRGEMAKSSAMLSRIAEKLTGTLSVKVTNPEPSKRVPQ
jgi:hypothetical protein